jgi:hypothetical protein
MTDVLVFAHVRGASLPVVEFTKGINYDLVSQTHFGQMRIGDVNTLGKVRICFLSDGTVCGWSSESYS